MGGEMSGLNRLFADRVYGPQPTRDDRAGRDRRQSDSHPPRKPLHPQDSPASPPSPGDEEAPPPGTDALGKIINYEA